MEISFKIIQDVTQAANQLVDSIGKLGNLFVNAVTHGVEGYEWLEAKRP